jgi:Zn-dependent M28 family amino/carboxypeptidase
VALAQIAAAAGTSEVDPQRLLEHIQTYINIDVVGTWGRTRDVQLVGFGVYTLEDDLARLLDSEHRLLVPDLTPEKGSYFRSDQFSFARVGVPSLNWP